MQTVQRTLVKSPPELWAELSDPDALARHLDAFGEVRIVDLRPESRVAWESELAAGVIELEPAGWGTRVSLSAAAAVVEEPPVPEPEPELEPDAETEPEPEPERPRFFARLRRLFAGGDDAAEPEAIVPPAPEAQPEPAHPAPPAFDADEAGSALERVLDTLGAAHHRPFSRG